MSIWTPRPVRYLVGPKDKPWRDRMTDAANWRLGTLQTRLISPFVRGWFSFMLDRHRYRP